MIIGPNGRAPNGWSPFGNTDKEIARNMKTGHKPNAPDAIRVVPTGKAANAKIKTLIDFLDGKGVTTK